MLSIIILLNKELKVSASKPSLLYYLLVLVPILPAIQLILCEIPVTSSHLSVGGLGWFDLF